MLLRSSLRALTYVLYKDSLMFIEWLPPLILSLHFRRGIDWLPSVSKQIHDSTFNYISCLTFRQRLYSGNNELMHYSTNTKIYVTQLDPFFAYILKRSAFLQYNIWAKNLPFQYRRLSCNWVNCSDPFTDFSVNLNSNTMKSIQLYKSNNPQELLRSS